MTNHSEGHGFKIYPLGDIDLPIEGKTSVFSPSVVDTIAIGLRDDGVVVWKRTDEADK